MSEPSLKIQDPSQGEALIVIPQGNWIIGDLSCYKKILENLTLVTQLTSISQEINIDLSELESPDTGGLLLLLSVKKKLEERKFFVRFQKGSKEVQQLIGLIQDYPIELKEKKESLSPLLSFLITLGEATYTLWSFCCNLLSFFGETLIIFFQSLLGKIPFRFKSFCSHLQNVGVNAIPIIALISFLIGVVLSYQGVTQLRRFGAEIFTVNLLAIGILREVGILLTAIVVAGRSGSAFTAQIGTMVLNEEIDAMRTMGLNPINVLVVPRIAALVVALPLLTFLSDILGILGGAFMTHILMDLSYTQFIDQLRLAATPTFFWIGMIKSPVFAFLIALVGCFEGLHVKGSAEDVGRHTTKSVVESIFMVIVADAAFSILFSYLDM